MRSSRPGATCAAPAVRGIHDVVQPLPRLAFARSRQGSRLSPLGSGLANARAGPRLPHPVDLLPAFTRARARVRADRHIGAAADALRCVWLALSCGVPSAAGWFVVPASVRKGSGNRSLMSPASSSIRARMASAGRSMWSRYGSHQRGPSSTGSTALPMAEEVWR